MFKHVVEKGRTSLHTRVSLPRGGPVLLRDALEGPTHGGGRGAQGGTRQVFKDASTVSLINRHTQGGSLESREKTRRFLHCLYEGGLVTGPGDPFVGGGEDRLGHRTSSRLPCLGTLATGRLPTSTLPPPVPHTSPVDPEERQLNGRT